MKKMQLCGYEVYLYVHKSSIQYGILAHKIIFVVDLCMNIAVLYNLFKIVKTSVVSSLVSNTFNIFEKKNLPVKIEGDSYIYDIMESE